MTLNDRSAMIIKHIFSILILSATAVNHVNAQYPTFGKVVTVDPAFEKLIGKDASIEVLAGGFIWTEGPVWSKERGSLLFSDVPKNTIFEWKEKGGISVFLNPSGYTGTGVYSDEPGSNGLIIDTKGNLVACEHGDRRVSTMPLVKGGKRTLSDSYQGKRLNSPNDVAEHPVSKEIYFTDPPYGLAKKADDPTREINVCGVYRVKSSGETELLVPGLSRPNGIAFSPDGKILYVAVSDPEKAVVMSYPVLENGGTGEGKVLFDATPMVKQGMPGLPDGLKTDSRGNIWTTGPGGVLVLSPAGKLLGRIETGRPTANCAWGDDGSTLYITAQHYLCRIRTQAKGAGWK